MAIFHLNPTGKKSRSDEQFQANLKWFDKQQHHFN